MYTRRTKWLFIPLSLSACLGCGIAPATALGQSHSEYCEENRSERLNAVTQEQWTLLISKAREYMSVCLVRGGETKEGAEEEARALFEIGFVLTKQAKFDEAIPIFRRCATVKPDDALCLDYLAEALDKEGEFGEELTVLNKCVTTKPDEASCWVDLGRALDEVGKRTDARKAYEQAISIGGFTEQNAVAIKLARECLLDPETATTFRGHRLGQSWQTFIRSEAGLCKLKQNIEDCTKAASGAEAALSQSGKDGYVTFSFEYGRLAGVFVVMSGPTSVEPGFLEKTYGTPSSKHADPLSKGSVDSYWFFSDGGEAQATERKSESGKFTITFGIHASDSTLRAGALAANPRTPAFNDHILGESWQKFAQASSELCRASEENAQECKNAASGESATLAQQGPDGLIEAFFSFKSGRLTQVGLNTRVPKFVELDYLDKTYGHPYSATNSPERDYASRRWDYADGGQVLATEFPGFLISITGTTVAPQ